MRSIQLTTMLLVPLAVLAQDVKPTILSSHDKIDGPFGGEYHVSDLRVFENGKVVYIEEGAKTMGDKPERLSYETTLPSDEMRRLRELLESREIRSLPKKVSSKTRPIDFFWQKSLEIDRHDKIQKIQIENFYPFSNLDRPVYPKALVELECNLQDIRAAAAKRLPPKDEDDWCKALFNQGKRLTSQANRTSGEQAQADCHKDEAGPTIVAGEGWGPVRMGAAAETVDAFLGEGHPGNRYSDVYFKDYPPKGVQVSFENTSDTVHAIYFYNGQRDTKQIGVFCGQTNSGINWQSSLEEVTKIYGHPTAEFSGIDSGGAWQRLAFAGIDFRFENGKMVRIGIPGS